MAERQQVFLVSSLSSIYRPKDVKQKARNHAYTSLSLLPNVQTKHHTIIMRIAILLAFICASIYLLPAQDQNQERDITHVISSDAFGEERTIRVHLPRRYLRTTDTFMVIYALDAQAKWYWDMAKDNVAYLVDNYQVLPTIIVGIVSANRGTEFLPAPRDTTIKQNTNGVAHLLQQHLREEVIPLIDSLYRVNTTRAIVGHSRGGAFIGHTLFSDQNDLFDAYVGISPALGYLNNQILDDAASVLANGESLPKFLYCTHGTVGDLERRSSQQVAHLDSLISAYPNEQLSWDWTQIDETTHWTVVIPSWNRALMKLSRAYGVDQYLLYLSRRGLGKIVIFEDGLRVEHRRLRRVA